MHSKATPNSPFTAISYFPHAKGKTAVKASIAHLFSRPVSLACKSLLLILLFGLGISKSWAQTYTTRVYANDQRTGTGGVCLLCAVDNAGNAVDNTTGTLNGFLNTKATLRVPLGVAGSIYQEYIFTGGTTAPPPSVTSGVILKIGSPANLLNLNLLGNITLQAYNGSTPVGSSVTPNASLLNLSLLASGNQTELFFPAPQPGGSQASTYDRVRLTLAGTVSLAQSLDVYAAYYTKPASGPVACDKAIDVLTGINGDVGALGGVANGPYAVDNDPATYATLTAAISVAGYAQATAIFPGLSAPGDSVRLILSNPASLLNLTLLQNLSVVTYNGNTQVDNVSGGNALLVLNLLAGASDVYTLSFKSSGSFDRIQIRMGGALATALTQIRVHEIQRVGPGPNSANGVLKTTCLNTPLTLRVSNPDLANLTYTWYDSNNAVIGNADSLVLKDARVATPGTYQYYVSATRKTCTTESAKTLVTVVVANPSTAADISVPTVPQYCTTDTVRITPSSSTITNHPVFRWYKDNGKTTPIINGMTEGAVKYFVDTTGKLSVTGLASGTYNYYVSVSDDSHCENTANALKQVSVTVGTAPAPPTLNQSYTVTTGLPLTLTANPATGTTVLWYSDTTQAPIGRGSTLTLPAFTTPGTYTYFAGDSLSGGCISYRLPVVITVTGPVVPSSCGLPDRQGWSTSLGCVLCSVTNADASIDADATNFATLTMPAGLLGGSIYQRLAFPAVGAPTDSIRLILGVPTGVADVSLLGGVVITVYNGPTTVVSTTSLASLLTLRLLDANRFVVTVPTGAEYDRVEVKLTGVANLLNSLNIYGARIVGANPAIATPNPVVCQGLPVTLSATPGAGTTIQWFRDSIGGTSLGNQNTFTTDSLKTAGVVKYYIQVMNGTCANPERIPVSITVKPLGTAANINVADTTNACGSSAAVITPTATGVQNPVFKWYLDANKATAITNGTVNGVTYSIDAAGKLSVSGLSIGNHTYYVSVSGDTTCENAAGNLKAATIAVGAAPAPPTVNQNVAVTTGLPVTLTAAPAAGATVLWYSDTTQAPIGRGSSITLPAFSTPGTYKYFAADSLPDGCISNKVTVTITVTGPVVPTSCNVPTSQVNGTSLGCVLCDVVNPTNDIDNDGTNFTKLSMPAGLLGGSVYQTLIFPNPGAATDSLRLDLESPVALADASLLGGIAVTVYNDNTVVKTTTLSSLLTLRLLGGNRFVATVPTGGAYDRVEIKLTGVANLLTSLNIYGVRAVGANPTVAASSQTVCQNLPATLSATPAAGTTLQWFKDSTGGVALSNQNTYVTDTLKTAGTVKYYLQVIGSNNCPNPERIPVTVTVNPLGTPGDITVADTTASCGSAPAVLTPVANGVTNPVFTWYANANKTTKITNGAVIGGATFNVDTTTGRLTITGLTTGTHTYYVSVSGTNRCENPAGSLKAVTVNVSGAPAPPTVVQNYTISTGLPLTLNAAPAPGTTVLWYSDTTLAPIGRGNTITLAPFVSPGVYTYFAGDSLPGGCVSYRLPITITVTGPSPIKCNMPNSQLTGTTLGCVLCSVTNPENDIDSINTNFTRLNIPVGLLGGSVYQRLIFPAAGAASDSLTFDLASPGGLADVSVLGGALITVYNGNTVVSTHPISQLLTLRLLSGNRYTATVPAGGAYDRVEVKLTGVANLLNSLDIYGVRAIAPDPAITATNVTVCQGQPAVLTATPAAGTSVKWYADSTSTVVLSSNATYTTDTLKTPGNFRYYVQAIGANGCPNPDRIPVVVTVYPTSQPGNINIADTTVACSSEPAVLTPTATGVTAPVFKWYKDNNKTAPITNGMVENGVTYAIDTTGKLTITGLAAGNYKYFVSVSSATQCENPAGALKAANVKIAAAPAAPVVSGQITIQVNTQGVVKAQPVPGATIVWFADATTNTVLATGDSLVVGPFSTPGLYTYYAAARVAGACDSKRSPVQVQVVGPFNPDPNCNFANAQSSGTTLGCILCSVMNPTNDVDSDHSNFTRLSVPVGALGGSAYQRLIFANPGSANDSIQLQLATPVGLADVSLLGGTLISLYNNNTLVKSDTLSRLLTLRLLNGQQFTATIAAPAAYDRVEVRLTGVLNLLNAIDIYSARVLYAKPTVKATMDTVCINSKATLSVTPAAGTSVRWYADSTSNVVLSTQNTYTTDTLKTAGKVTYYVAVVGGPNNCPNPDRIPVSVYVTPAPSVPGAPVVVQVCPGSSVDLQVANADRRFTYNWYNVPTGGNKLNTDSGYTFRLTAVSRDTVLYVAAVNSCGAISDRQQFTVQMAPSLSAPVVTPNPDSVAIGTQAVLTATSNTANVIFKWYGSQAGNDSLFTGPVYTPTSNTAGTVTYWVEASLNGGSTCKSIRVPVVVVYGTRPTSSVPCEGASSQSVGSSGLLVLGGVYNQGLSVDNDANTASSLVIDAGLLNAQVWQRAKFVGVSAPGDTVRVLLSNPSQVLSAALLGAVQITSYNGSTPGDSVSVNNPLVKLVILSSKKQALIEFVPTKPFDAVEVKLKSGILGALTTIDFNYAQRALVAPKVQAANVTACAGGTATLNVQDPVTGITYRWYNSQGVYLTGKDGSSFTTGNLTKDTAFYVEAFRNNCASSSRTRVDVKVTAAPVAPAVLATNVEVCSGSDAVLAVANPVRGYSYAWYNVASGGTKLNTDSGFTYKVVNVTAKATYYVEAINDSCHTVSATRTAVTVNTAAALAPPTVDPSVDTIVIGQQGLFRASAAVANAEFNWYASDTSTNILFTGSTFTTPKATALGRTVYYVEAVLPGGATCKSARVPATVVVINGDPSIVPCEGATSEINGRTGITIGSVVNPEFAVDDKISTASSLVINLGVGNGSVYQRAMFKGISTAGDTVKVMLSNPGQILSAAVLASVQLTTYNGNTAGDSVLVSNPLVHLDLLSNSRRAILSFVPTKPFDGVEVKLRSGILGALTAVDFNYAQRAIAQPKVQVNGSATICKGKQATLAVVNPAAGIVYSWYDSKGVHLADSVAYVTPATLGTGTYNYFVTASRNNCTSAASAQVAVTVLGLPSAPVPVANDVKTCINTPVTLSVQPVTGVQFNWYDAATGGAKLASNSNTYTTPANLPAGTYNFFVEAVNASNCANDSARTKIVVTVDSAATAVDIVANDQVICNGQNAVLTPSSTTVQNPVFKWYANPDKTGPITAGVDSKGVLTITGLTPGAYTYYVSVSNNGRCENQAGNLKAVKVTVNSNAVAADINVADTTICLNTTVKLTATSTTVTNPVFKWYKDATLSTLLFTGATYTTDQLTATTSYYVTVEGANKCANSAANAKVVTVNVREVNTPVIAASSISICAGDTATLSIQNAENGVTYKWYNTATGGTAIFTGPVYVVRGLTQSTDFYAEASVGSCTSATRTKVSIGVGVAPKPIVESTDVTVCQGGSAILKVTSSTTNITYKWYTTATGGTAVFTGPIFTAGPITTNTAYYVEAIGDTSKCGKPSERVKVNVTAVPVPAAPVLVSSTVQGCVGQSATLAIKSPVPGTTYQWYDAPTNGTLVFEGEVFNIASIDSTVTYYVQASVNGSCPSATRTSATIRANSIPAVPEIAASSLTVCQGGSVTLSIKNPVAGVTYRWYDALTGGKLLFTGSSFTTGALDKTTDFYAEASNGACSSNQRAKITVGVGQAPTPVLESNALTVCTGSTAALRVTSATNGVTYKWYTQASGGTPVFTGPVYTTDKLTTSTDYYVEAVGDAGSCGSPSARVKASVTVVPAPDAPDVVATSLKTCAGTGVTVAVKTVKPGITYQWYDAPQGGSLLFTGAVYSVQVVTANTTYYVQANLGSGCASSTRTAVNVSVDPAPPVPTVASDNETTCIGGTVTFTVTNPGASTTYRWYDAPSGGTLLATGTAYTTAPLAATTTIYLEALNSFGCSSVRKGLTATVVNDINAPLVDPITVCAGQSGVLQIKNRSNNVIYRWYTVPTGGTAVFTGADFTVSPTSTVTYYAEAATSGGCISASRTPVKVTVNPSPAAPAVADASPEVCAGQSVVLNVLNPDATLTYKWYTTPTGGTPVATGAMYPTNAINTNQMFYVEATNNNACPSPTRTAVSVLAIPAPAIPTVTGNTSICPGSSATLTAASTTAGVNFRWYSVANGGTPLFTGTSYTTQPLNTATTYYVEAFTAGGCVSATRKAVDVTMAEPLPAPTVTVDNATATAVTFRWNAVTGAQRYEVSVDNGVTFIPPSSGANGTTHTISNLQPNQSVSIQVRAIGAVACENSALASANGKSTNPNGNNIFVPNLFSPNGDGMNDIMYVYGTSIAQLEFRIYNQWGQLVFTSKDQRQGWDGTMSGQRQPVGVYVYIVKATMQDGTVVTKKGNVTLMR